MQPSLISFFSAPRSLLFPRPPPSHAKQPQLEPPRRSAVFLQIATTVVLCRIGGRRTRVRVQGRMEATGGNKKMRSQITDATAATFADSTVIPDRYVRSDEVQNGLVVDELSFNLPIVDAGSLLDPEVSAEEIVKLGSACREWGLFLLTNHGVDDTVVERMKDNAVQFFNLSLEEKRAVDIKEDGFHGFGHHVSNSSGKMDWAECLLIGVAQPVESRNMEVWPTNPTTFRDALDKYSMEMTNLTSLLMVSMASDLGVKRETIVDTFQGKGQKVILHHYPPCRHADKVIGITPHTDSSCLTVLLDVHGAPGLQAKKDGRWFPVWPLAGSLLVFVGDTLEVLTNGRYRSAEHRVLADADRSRTTVVAFQSACVGGVIKPLEELGEARYRSIEKAEYLKAHFGGVANGSRFIESLKIHTSSSSS